MPAKPNDLTLYDLSSEEWWGGEGGLQSLRGMNAPRFAYFDQFIPEWEGRTVLDVGCGGGFTSEFLAARGAAVAGIDQSEGACAAATEHAGQSGLDIDYRRGLAEDLPYADGVFETVVCVDVLEHVSDLRKVIEEIHRVLEPGGVFLFDTINRTFLSKIVVVWLLEGVVRMIPKGVHDWNLFIKPAELMALLEEAGFSHVDLQGFNLGITDRRTGEARARFGAFKALMYIGAARRA